MIKQCATLTPKTNFLFKPFKGRKIQVKTTDSFWVCSAETTQRQTGLVYIARKRDNMHYNWPFDEKILREHFIINE